MSTENKAKVPEIECPQVEREAKTGKHILDIYILAFTLLLVVLGILSQPQLLQQVEWLSLTLIVLSGIYLKWGHTSSPFRRWLSFKARRLFWQRFLLLQCARTELLILYYEKVLRPYSRQAARDAYIAYRKFRVITHLRDDPKPKPGLRTDLERVRKLTSERKSWNNPIYRLETITAVDNELSLEFGPGCYYDYVDTCEMMGLETDRLLTQSALLLFRRRFNLISSAKLQDSYRILFRKMVSRRLFATDKVSLLDQMLGGKCSKVGICNVTLLKDPTGGYKFLLALRGRSVLEFPDAYHVVPAGTYEPSKRESFYDKREREPIYTVLRELYEECFLGDKKGEYDLDPYPLDQVLKFRAILDIVTLLERPETAEFKVCGVYVDYYNAKVEMTTCLVIHDERYLDSYNNELVTNWEHCTEVEKLEFSETVIDEWMHSDKILPIGSVAIRDAAEEFGHLIIRG